MRKNKKKETQNEEGLRVVMWHQGESKEELVYVFQLHARSTSLLHRVAKAIQGTSTGSGFDRKKKEKILLIKKYFSSKNDFEKFTNNFEYAIEKAK